MKLYAIILFLFCISACQSARSLPALPTGATLPQNNGYVVFERTDTLTGVSMPEINRVAQAWIKEHTGEYAFEWQPPVYKAELLYAGQIWPEKIQVSDSAYYTRRTVHYLLTVAAKAGSHRLILTNFDVAGIERRMVPLEKLISDQALCKSVGKEAEALLKSMSTYIRNAAQKSL